MAKGRHTTALFEVVTRNKPMTEQRGRGLLAPLGQLFRPRQAGDAAPVAPAAESPVPEATPAASPLASPASLAYPQRPALLVDSDRREISLRLSYTSAVISAFAFVTVVGAAYLVGRKAAPAPGPALAATSTEDIQRQSPDPSVLEVGGSGPAQVETAPPAHRQAASPDAARSAAPVVVDGKNRTVGMNYVVIQSYAEEKQAQDAVKALADGGVEATIERKLKGWLPSWYIVVGTKGFARLTGSPPYDTYLRKIKDISNKYVGDRVRKPSFKAFEPSGYKWRAEDAK